MAQRHVIRTLTDIQAAVNHENLDRFLVDLKMFLEYSLMAEDANAILPDVVIEQPPEMVWEDDGKHDATINITIHQ